MVMATREELVELAARQVEGLLVSHPTRGIGKFLHEIAAMEVPDRDEGQYQHAVSQAYIDVLRRAEAKMRGKMDWERWMFDEATDDPRRA